MPTQFPTTLADNPVAQALSYAKVVVTLKSLKTGQHLTLKLTAKAKQDQGGYAKVTSLDDATHVFVNDFNDWRNKAGTFYPRNGRFFPAADAHPALVFAAEQVLQYATQGTHHPLVEIQTQTHCCRCGKELEDPISIERGFGPDCYGLITGSKAVSRKARGAKVSTEHLVKDINEANYRQRAETGEVENTASYYAHSDARRSDDR